jgi:ubiquinone/menaquinone biosynthesis C-methylase UbiE
MVNADAAFTGSIPELYDRYLRPILFEPYAEDLAARAAALKPRRILEIAAGTGVVTEAVLKTVPGAEIVATDLNQAMLDVAEKRLGTSMASFRQMDAQALDFTDSAFDLVLCQFGVMFFPDRVAAYREARRVLAPRGHFLFNVWASLQDNAISAVIADTVARELGGEGPSFVQRVPFGYHDRELVEGDLRAAGFTEISCDTVDRRSRFTDPRDAATGLCLGSPLRVEIEARAPGRMDALVDAVADALADFATAEGIDAPMRAHVFTAR